MKKYIRAKIISLLLISFIIGISCFSLLIACSGNRRGNIYDLRNAINKTAMLDNYCLSITQTSQSDAGGNELDSVMEYRVDRKNKTAAINTFSQHGNTSRYIVGNMQYISGTDYYGPTIEEKKYDWDDFDDVDGKYLKLAGVNPLDTTLNSYERIGDTDVYKLKLSKSTADDFCGFSATQIVDYNNASLIVYVASNGYWSEATFECDFEIISMYRSITGKLQQHFTVSQSSDKISVPAFYMNYYEIKNIGSSASYTYSYPYNFADSSAAKVELPAAPVHETYNSLPQITYQDFTAFSKIIYDEKTNLIIVADSTFINFLDPRNFTVVQTLAFSEATDIAADNGILVAASGTRGIIEVYDIATLALLNGKQSPNLDYYYSDLPYITAIDGDNIFYSHINQFCEVHLWNYKTGESKLLKTSESGGGGTSIYSPELSLDKKSHTLYITETGLSSTDFFAFDSLTGEHKQTREISDLIYYLFKPRDAYFDGELLHVGGVTLNSDATAASANDLTYIYNPLNNFTPAATLFSHGNIDIISGFNGETHYIAAYDKNIHAYIFCEKFYGKYAMALGDYEYLIVGAAGKYVAKIDLSNATPLPENADHPQLTVTKTYSDGMIKANFKAGDKAIIDKAVIEGKYIYLLMSERRTVEVIDANSYAPVRSMRFLFVPVDIDVHGDTIAVAMGNSMKFAVINIKNWSVNYAETAETVFKVAVYADAVYYCGTRYDDEVYTYSITSGNVKPLNENSFRYGNYPIVLTDKNTGDLYVGGGSGTTNVLYKIDKSGRQTLVWSRNDYSPRPYISGNYLSVFGYLFDTETGYTLEEEVYATIVPSGYLFGSRYSNIGISYYDGRYSACISPKGNQSSTILYDSEKKRNIAEYSDIAGQVVKKSNKFFVFGSGVDYFYVTSI